jgi:hypothetical protein
MNILKINKKNQYTNSLTRKFINDNIQVNTTITSYPLRTVTPTTSKNITSVPKDPSAKRRT